LNELRISYYIYHPVDKGGTGDAVTQAARAKKSNFDSVILGDDFATAPPPIAQAGLFGSAFVVAGTIASLTKIPINVLTDPWKRHPAIIAQEMATLDQLTGGRAALTLGGGEAMNFIPFGIVWSKPVDTLREATIIIKKLWSATHDQPADFSGEIFTLKRAFMRPTPIQKPGPPIYLGAWRPRLLRTTGQVADGHFPWMNSPSSFSKRIFYIKEGATEAGRDLASIDKATWLPVFLNDDREAAYQAIQGLVKTCLLLEGEVLRYHGCMSVIGSALSQISSLFDEKDMILLKKLEEEVPRNVVEECCAAGNVDECIEKMQKFIDVGANHIFLSVFNQDFDTSMEIIGQKVIPHFRNK
jgi:phthiodiolone/phenolphthiodiolone dimycocerosates ketoreductase